MRTEKLTIISFPGFFISTLFACGLFLLPGFVKAQVPLPGEIIINELMWMGMGSATSDEWLELYNPTSSDLTLETCHIENKTGKVIVSNANMADKSIPAGGYFVASYKAPEESKINYPSAKILSYLALSNTELEIKLICLGEIIDTAGNGAIPPAGENGTVKKSMERKAEPGNGVDTTSWQTCFSPINLDTDSTDCATPGGANSRASDPDPEPEPEPIPAATDIRLNEIFPSPASGGKEFIELVNFGKSPVDLTGFSLEDGAGHKLSLEPATPLTAGGFYFFEGNLYLNNTGEEKITLYDKDGKELDSTSYLDPKENRSWSRDNDGWKWSTTATPGTVNIITAETEPDDDSDDEPADDTIYPGDVYLSEILPNPKDDEEKNEYIEIYNTGSEKVSLKDWKLKDLGKTGYKFPDDTDIESGEYLAIYREDFTFALNNSGAESVSLIDPDGHIISKVSYDKTKEDVSYNFAPLENAWSWSKYLTPGAENTFNKDPKIKITKDKNFYKNMWANFSVKVRDPEKEKVKVTWDFGNDHKSYKEKTRHRYEKKGKYEVSLTVFDGSEETVKKFRVEVKDFPKYEMEVVSLCPNPKGKDADNEWLLVKNDSGKKVDLENWSIATGTKNLVNHPIRESIEIEPGETKKLTRKDALFSLPNKKGKLELRYPNGKRAFKMDYEKDKILEDETYERIDGRWVWITPPQPQEAAAVNEEVPLDEIDYQKLIEENLGMFSSERLWPWNINSVFSENKNIRTELVQLKNNRKLYIAYDNDTNDRMYSFTPPVSHCHWISGLTEYINTLMAKVKSVQLGIL